MLVLTPKYGSQNDIIDSIKKQKESKKNTIVHRRQIDLNNCKDIYVAQETYLKNKNTDIYINPYRLEPGVSPHSRLSKLFLVNGVLDVSWIDISLIDDLTGFFLFTNAYHIVGLEKWDVSHVRSFASMFTRAKNLQSISDISGWDVSNVENMFQMFGLCFKLENVGDLNGWELHKNVKTADMFMQTLIESNNTTPIWYQNI